MIRKLAAIVGSALFLVIAPGFVAGLVPWRISHWRFQSAFLGLQPLRLAGGILITLGTVGLLDSFRRFAVQGLGTPAPVFPTRHLVMTGLYRYVRNPMYVAVVSAIIGQALIFGNMRLVEYGGLVWLLFHLFVLVYEEPTLRASFGAEYEVFCAEVPRWVPRLTPWDGHLNGPCLAQIAHLDEKSLPRILGNATRALDAAGKVSWLHRRAGRPATGRWSNA